MLAGIALLTTLEAVHSIPWLVMPVISSNKPYRIGRSKTGLGLFATRPIKKGAKIIRYIGPMLDCRKKKDDAVENKYLFQISKRWTIDGSTRKNVARYINHACKPNAESDVNVRKRKVHIRAIKNIAPGEEINYDYGTEYFKEYLKPIGCKCDACEKKRAKQRAEARAEKAKDSLKMRTKATRLVKGKAAKTSAKGEAVKAKTAKTKAANTKPAKAKVAGAKSFKGAGAKTTRTKTTRAKTTRTKTARTSSRRTADYARAASSGARPGPQADSTTQAARGVSLQSAGVTA
jgi:hypothetical protein